MELKEKLSLYGVDVEETMERFIDDIDLYKECLSEFIKDKEFDLLKESLDDNDIKASFDHAHALKGVSANLGLTPLYNSICDLVEPLRVGDDSSKNELYDKIMDELEKVKKLLD